MSESKETTYVGTRFGMRRFHKWEAIALRVLFAWLIFQCLPLDALGPRGDDFFGNRGWFGTAGGVDETAQKHPHGLARWFDLTFMSKDSLQLPLWIISIGALISYVIGRGLIISLPILTTIMILAWTLYNSNGFAYHGYKLIGLILLAQTVVVWVHAISKWVRKKPALASADEAEKSRYSLNDYLIRFTQVTIIAAYVIAGATKLIKSDGQWIQKSHYSALYIVKTYRQNYYKDLDKEKFGEERVPWANEMLENPNATRFFMMGGLFLELFCFIGLWSRWLMAFVGLGLVVFHRMVDYLMNLQFYQNEVAVWIFLVNPVFWIVAATIAIAKKSKSESPPEKPLGAPG
ncbi:MAG: hypothetical protein ACI8UO_002352 [Verrucomicrobiales bacterium]|jgi:hypothetical protein